jgi:hypothetical protein
VLNYEDRVDLNDLQYLKTILNRKSTARGMVIDNITSIVTYEEKLIFTDALLKSPISRWFFFRIALLAVVRRIIPRLATQ